MLGATNPIAIKLALSEGWNPFQLGVYRMGVIGIFFWAWTLVLKENALGPDSKARKLALTAAAFKGIGVACFYSALWLIPASRAVIISTLSPVINLLLIHLILEHEHVKKNHIIGISISFFGICLLLFSSRPNIEQAASKLNLLGDGLMILSVIFHNAMVIYEKKALNSGANPQQLLVSTNLFSVVIFSLLSFYTGTSFSEIPHSSKALFSYLYLITVMGVFFFYFRRWLVGKFGVSYPNSFSYLGKALSIIYAFVLLGETIPIQSILYFGLIALGTIIAVRQDNDDTVSVIPK